MNSAHPSHCTRRWGPLAGLIAVLTVSLMGGPEARGADKSASSRLSDYLRQLGFEEIEYRWDDVRSAWVHAELDGTKVKLVLDTGWERTTLDEHAARGLKTLGELGLKLEDSYLGRLSDPDLVLMRELTIGRAKFLNQPARVRKLGTDFQSSRYAGVLECDFLMRNHCLLDCGGRRLYVRGSKPSETVLNAVAGSLRLSGLAEVPMSVEPHLQIDTQIKGHSVRWQVYLGYYVTVLDDSQISRLSLTSRESLGVWMGTGMAAHELKVTEFRRLRVGTQEWKNVQVSVADLKAWGVVKPGVSGHERHGVLGADLLVDHGALIDCPGRRIWFRPER